MSVWFARGAPNRGYSAVWSSALLTGSRVVSALAVNKIIATYLGPGGLALVGQFQNFSAIVFGVTSGNVTNAVIATVSSARDELALQRAISTVVAIMAIATGLMALVVAFGANVFALRVLDNTSFTPVMLWFALLMVPLILNVVLLAVAAGLGRVRAFVTINIGVTILSVPVCLAMVLRYGVSGALLSAVIVNAAALVASGAWLWRARPFPIRWMWSGIDTEAARRLFRLAAMTITTTIAVPAAQFLVRSQVLRDFGAAEAGQWQAALKTGEVLLMATSVMVAIYFIPRFSSAGIALRSSAVRAAVSVTLGLAVLGATAVSCSGLILPLLFSRDFSAAAALLPMQIAGDVLRGGAIVLQSAFMATASAGRYVAVDLIYACTMVAVGLLSVPHLGPHGATLAVLAASACSLCAALLLMQRARSGNSGT